MTTSYLSQKPLRLWPGVVAVALQWLLLVGVPLVNRDMAILGLLGGIAFGLLVIVWWLFFSRAPWLERLGAIALMILGVAATRFFVDPSIAGAGMGRMHPMLSIPPLCLGLVAALVVTRNKSTSTRRAVVAGAILIAAGSFTLIRTGGVSGDGISDFHWRWTPTPEQRLLAQAANEPHVPVTAAPTAAPAPASPIEPAKTAEATAGKSASPAATSAAATTPTEPAPVAEWPGFRGAERDDVIHGVRIETDWTKTPPIEIWRKPIGPGWSSFAVQGDLIYTQEQRGDDELVSSYSLTTGAPVWRHKDAARFYESNGGPGPRATPAIAHGRVYALGA
ncbi:MAG TPA: hypothetical protein VL282_07960, partial [Tepidisphaeraceae bacterium]|nr:hypothetical protein [Tepidisphaeraceae bacterium]